MADLNTINQPLAVAVDPPLVVDLDGTLVKSDTLMDSLALLARTRPQELLNVPFWTMKGKAHLKSQVGSVVTLDAAHLPYNQKLLEHLHQEKRAGRKLYLATGADLLLAERVTEHLGIFDDVLASDGNTNLTGHEKLASIQRRFSGKPFDYVGNALPDLPLLENARAAMVANPTFRLSGMLKVRKIPVAQRFVDRSSPIMALAKAARVHQWAKNILIFFPLLLAHTLRHSSIVAALVAFVCFCLAASATYILNDLLDLETDRRHLTKRRRAFASGDLSVLAGVGMSAVFLAASLAAASFLPVKFMEYLLLYLVSTLAYSLALKRIVLVDVILLSSLYTVRVLAGAAATVTYVSPWLAAFSIFLFLSLAMVKRFSELENLSTRGITPANGRGYLLSDIEQLRSFGTSSAYASILIFALYINGRDVTVLYHHPARMWLITPLMILWLSRIWLLASRGLLDEDPVVFALTDRMSLLMGLAVILIAIAAL